MALWNILNPADLFYNVLEEDFEDYKKDPLSPRKALHCILVGWHLVDWTYEAYGSSNTMNIGEYRKSLYPKCPELKIMHDIAQELKHWKVSWPKTEGETEIHLGAFSAEFSPGFDTERLRIVYKDNEPQDVLPLIESVVRFWDTYFAELEEYLSGDA